MLFRKTRPSAAVIRTVKTFGLSEKSVKEKLKGSGLQPDILEHPKGVDILVKTEGGTESSAKALADAAEKTIRTRLGNSVFGTDKDKMEEVAGRLLTEAGKTLAVAESCTGGLICHLITNIPGSSKYFKQGFVVYDDRAKIKTLGVDPAILEKFGSVSEETAEEMAGKTKQAASADIAIAVSGNAGPDGGTQQKPVGTVFICVLTETKTVTTEFHFKGWRELIKIQSAQAALDALRKLLADSK